MEDYPEEIYRVVTNHEDRYSVWPFCKEIPAGWRDAGFAGPKDDCLAHIAALGPESIPKSLRDRMP